MSWSSIQSSPNILNNKLHRLGTCHRVMVPHRQQLHLRSNNLHHMHTGRHSKPRHESLNTHTTRRKDLPTTTRTKQTDRHIPATLTLLTRRVTTREEQPRTKASHVLPTAVTTPLRKESDNTQHETPTGLHIYTAASRKVGLLYLPACLHGRNHHAADDTCYLL